MKRRFSIIGLMLGLFLLTLPGGHSGNPALLLAQNYSQADEDLGAGFDSADLLLLIPGIISAVKSPSDMILTADPEEIPADVVSTSVIRADVTRPDGQPVADGTEVRFSTTAGAISPETAATQSGTAGAVLTSSDISGTAHVTARAGRVSRTVDILFKDTANTIDLGAQPLNVQANGTDFCTITAAVTDGSGNPVPNGTEVTFSTDLGTFSNGADTDTVATADDSGEMANFLRSTSPGPAHVTVTSPDTQPASITVTFFRAGPDAMTLQAEPTSLKADGASTSTIRAMVTDGADNPVDDGTVVSFSVTVGTGVLSSGTATTSGGIATVTYTASVTPGTETIRADTTNGVSQTVDIELTGPAVGGVTVTPGSETVIADGVSSTTIFAHVKDTYGNDIPNGTEVTFTTTAGTISEVTTTLDGIATATLTSPTNRGTATVQATAGGVSGSTTVQFIAGPPAHVTVTATPANLTADGASTSAIAITVLDANNNPVENDTTLTLSALWGTLNELTATTTDGMASAVYTAPNYVPVGGQDTINVETTVVGATGSVQVTLIGPQIATITLSADPESLPADGSSTATITATLTVVGGGAAPDGTTVNFSITQGGGSITPTATTGGGMALATLTSGDTAETATIQAEAGGRTAQIDVDYTPGSVTLSIVPNSLLGTGDQTATVTVTLKEADGTAPATDQTVEFSLSDDSLGTIDSPVTVPAGQGEAKATFHAKAKGGTVTVTGTWETGGVEVSGSEDMVVHPPPAFIQVADGFPDPAAINIKGTGGQSTSQIVFDVKDQAGDLVVDGYRLDFVILSGPNGGEEISPAFATTVDGQVSTILRSGHKSGPVSIKATYHHDTNVSTVTGQITIVAGPPVGEEFGISAQFINISGLSHIGLEDLVTVSVGDIYGNAVPDNTALSFKTYNTGGLFEPGSGFTSGGTATNTLLSVSNPSPMQGFLSITAEAVNGGRTTHVTSIAVTPRQNPADPQILYAGTDGGGVYKSIDSGASWENISHSSTTPGQNWIDPYVNDIAIDPDNENSIYAATGYLGSGHLYRSVDGGATWNSNHTEEFAGVVTTDSAVLTVLCDDDGSDYVWIGTNGAGAYLSEDGESFKVGGAATPVAPTQETVDRRFDIPGRDGYMEKPGLSETSQTERWTVTYHVPEATATVPMPGLGNLGNGTMSNVTTDHSETETETWTVTYHASVGPVTPGVTNTGDGAVASIQARHPNGASETWTLTCIDAADPATFSVRSLYGGVTYAYPNATVDQVYDEEAIGFIIVSGGTPFAAGDSFTFTTAARWQVSGSVSGAQSSQAETDIPYTSDGNQVAFTINAGSVSFAVGDLFTFSTVAAETPYWMVEGEFSGLQARRAYNGYEYRSDNDEISFTIEDGTTNPFEQDDEFIFDVEESGLGHGKVVTDIVKVPGTKEDSAVLYAGTASGVYRSDDGGKVWTETASFTGDNITALALHPDSDGVTDIIYAGTEDSGVWVSTDSGANWEQEISGLGKGLSASTPVADFNNVGTGIMSAVTVGDDARSEVWVVECKSTTPNPVFSVTGTASGEQADYDIGSGDPYVIPGVLSFSITEGATPFEVGDFFSFRTTRDPGLKIKDLLLDAGNDRLYAVTYFWGPLEAHAVGNVYSVGLSGYVPGGDWAEANEGLSQYDPPDDTTLFAQHVLVSDIPPYEAAPGAATTLYIGGEGINLYRAVTGLSSGSPVWNQSKTGLTNQIMARMPVLFSGLCGMEMTETAMGGEYYLYTVYIQDAYGNPPISGSRFTVTTHNIEGDLVSTVLNVTYPDTYTYTGTFRDPSDPDTNNPYTVVIGFTGDVAEAKFTFTPTCEDTVPGCSGSEQSVSKFH